MLNSYIPIAVMMAVAAVLAIGMVTASAVLGPRHPTKYKNSPYECGMTPVGSARERFPIKFYMIAMLFIIFDIETIFLYPWAVTFIHQVRSYRLFLLAEMGVFVAILFIGYGYIYKKGALDWDEGQQDGERPDIQVFGPRAPIRFGNEYSGPVKLAALVQTSPEDHFTTESRETVHPPVASGKA
jgi:NADH-quinone oxidoreductase subunit A